jgi:peptidase E
MAEQPTPTQPLTNRSRTTIVNMKSNYIIFIVTAKKKNQIMTFIEAERKKFQPIDTVSELP